VLEGAKTPIQHIAPVDLILRQSTMPARGKADA